MNTDLERAAEALRLGRLDEAELHAWNALLTVGSDDIVEFRRIVAVLGSSRLQRELDVCWPAGAAPAPASTPARVRWRRAHLRFSLVVLIVFAVFKVLGMPTESGPLPATSEAVVETADLAPTLIAGDGIWLVPLGRVETVDLSRLASDISSTYSAWAGPVEVVALPPSTLYPTEEQLNAEALIDLLNERYKASGRGNAAAAPVMALMGRLEAPGAFAKAFVAGDKRANENIALSSTHTLFALEHNRIVSQLPRRLSEEEKFQIARRVIGAEQQYITYNEFLPALGVRLPTYRGYDNDVNASLGNEFAVVGYRAHSMIHGEFEAVGEAADYTAAQLAAIEAQGVEVDVAGDEAEFVIPLNLAFGNPDLLKLVHLDAVLHGIGGEPEYKNDEMIDNQLRSVLFQVPVSGNEGCLDGPTLPECFKGVVDLGAVDVVRGRDHGMPLYNDLRRAFGLSEKHSFTSITGESTDRFPTNDPKITGNPLNDPNILDFVALFDADGNPIPLGSEAADAEAVVGTRRTTLAARLKAIYGDTDKLDAFVGMVSERHVRGTEFGELQLEMWKQQFQALRDGDRFFYLNDPELRDIERQYGITYRRTLGQIIEQNAGIDVQDNVFVAVEG